MAMTSTPSAWTPTPARIRFNEKVFHSDNPEPLGNGASMNCYATPSPVIEPGRVYVHFGSFGTACLDTEHGQGALETGRPAAAAITAARLPRRSCSRTC